MTSYIWLNFELDYNRSIKKIRSNCSKRVYQDVAFWHYRMIMVMGHGVYNHNRPTMWWHFVVSVCLSESSQEFMWKNVDWQQDPRTCALSAPIDFAWKAGSRFDSFSTNLQKCLTAPNKISDDRLTGPHRATAGRIFQLGCTLTEPNPKTKYNEYKLERPELQDGVMLVKTLCLSCLLSLCKISLLCFFTLIEN